MWRRSIGRKGQGLVEFALVVPIFLLLLIGIAEFGRAWMTRSILTGAAREAVRIYAVNDDWSVAQARAENILTSAGLDQTLWSVSDNVTATEVRVTVTYQFPLVVAGFIPGLGSGPIALNSSTTMRKEY